MQQQDRCKRYIGAITLPNSPIVGCKRHHQGQEIW
jgi:hypothetical protein